MAVSLRIEGIQQMLIDEYGDRIRKIFEDVRLGKAVGCDMTGWIEWVNRDHSELIKRAEDVRDSWKREGVKKVVVIGTGGSYIACRGGLEYSRSLFRNAGFEFVYVPYFSGRYLEEMLEGLNGVKFGVVVISKSGTTLESAVAFRLIREKLFRSEGANYGRFVVAVTDREKGVLRGLADANGFVSFVIEDDIGGRYSVLTAVGIVPMVLGDVDVRGIFEGAKRAYKENFNGEVGVNRASLYAAFRHYMAEKKGLINECLIGYEPHLRYTLEAIKQLFAESEGKDGRGLMPIVLDFTPDLHSVGQLLQDGKKTFFESTFFIKDQSNVEIGISKSSFGNDDQLDWISGKSLWEINRCAFMGTLYAHRNEGGIDNVVIEIDDWSPNSWGYLYYWLSLAAMFSSYLFGVNPFNQPGVEAYKKRMFKLLGK